MTPVPHFPNDWFTEIGSFQVTDTLVVGENFEQSFADAAGTWTARWIETESFDALYAEREAAGEDVDDQRFAQQMQVYLSDSDPEELLGSLEFVCTLGIHAAWFRAGDGSLEPILREQTAIGPLFDGVEGLIGGAGVSVYLGGDGAADVYAVHTEFGPELIHITLR